MNVNTLLKVNFRLLNQNLTRSPTLIIRPTIIPTGIKVAPFHRQISNSAPRANLTIPKTKPISVQNNTRKIIKRAVQNNDSLINESYTNSKEEKTYHNGHFLRRCVSATTCETYDLDKVQNLLFAANGLPNEEIVRNEAIHFRYRPTITHDGGEPADVFVLRSGTIVAWDVEESEVLDSLIPMFRNAMINAYDVQTEDLDYIDMEGKGDKNGGCSFIDGEIICIQGETDQKLLDKVAFSYGISRSTRLAILESSLEQHIKLTKETTENLSKGIELKISAKEVLQSSGRLMLLRGKLNLYSELIETPDLCWSEPNLELIYNDISKVLDVNSRISILNRKLDYTTDEARVLLDVMTTRKGTRLEWIIIYLIMIEVCFEVYHFYERFIEKQAEKKNSTLE